MLINLEKAQDIMRQELFAPLGVRVKLMPVEWTPPRGPFEEAATQYDGPFGPPEVIQMRTVPSMTSSPLVAAATLAHEMSHVATQPLMIPFEDNNGHPAKWQRLVKAIGLELDLPWHTVPGPRFIKFYNEHLKGVIDA